VPLRLGGGTRLKIVEGMAMHKAIVSTTLGAEGIEAVPERDLLIADDEALGERPAVVRAGRADGEHAGAAPRECDGIRGVLVRHHRRDGSEGFHFVDRTGRLGIPAEQQQRRHERATAAVGAAHLKLIQVTCDEIGLTPKFGKP